MRHPEPVVQVSAALLQRLPRSGQAHQMIDGVLVMRSRIGRVGVDGSMKVVFSIRPRPVVSGSTASTAGVRLGRLAIELNGAFRDQELLIIGTTADQSGRFHVGVAHGSHILEPAFYVVRSPKRN